MRLPLLLLLATALPAATAQDIITAADASLTETQRDEPGSPARAEAIAAALEGAGQLPPAELLAVRLALAEAWLDGAQPTRCAELAAAVQGDAAATPALRERAALARAAAARALVRNLELPAAKAQLDALAAAGDAGPRAAAHQRIVRAEIALALDENRKPADAPAALAALDEALALLREAPAADRVPVFMLRMVAMERGGAKPPEVLAWLQQHAADPAAAGLMDSAMAENDAMLGKPAPALKAARLDRPGEVLDLASLRGKPVLVDFFATWCAPCAAVAPAVAAFAKAHPEVQVVGVSLDNPQTLADLPAFMAKHAITWPVIGENLGWDGELDDAWRVTGIPHLFLVAADGTLAANDLIGQDTAGTLRKLDEALAALAAGAKPPEQATPAPAPRKPAGRPAPFP